MGETEFGKSNFQVLTYSGAFDTIFALKFLHVRWHCLHAPNTMSAHASTLWYCTRAFYQSVTGDPTWSGAEQASVLFGIIGTPTPVQGVPRRFGGWPASYLHRPESVTQLKSITIMTENINQACDSLVDAYLAEMTFRKFPQNCT